MNNITLSKSEVPETSMQTHKSTSPPSATPTDVADEVSRLRKLCRVMDQAFQLPGTDFRLGLDSLIGLVPGVGDATSAIVSLYVIHRARKIGIRNRTTARMLGNVLVDTVIGTVPVVGDLFDAAWKANTRNLQLLEDELLRKS